MELTELIVDPGFFERGSCVFSNTGDCSFWDDVYCCTLMTALNIDGPDNSCPECHNRVCPLRNSIIQIRR